MSNFNGLTKYDLPDGASLMVKRPTNGVRRILVEQPETNLKTLLEILAAACVMSIDLPEGYTEDGEPKSLDFSKDPLNAECWKRIDNLTLTDCQAFVDAFVTNNSATKDMIDRLLAATSGNKVKK